MTSLSESRPPGAADPTIMTRKRQRRADCFPSAREDQPLNGDLE
jgi:hypothetical protein